MKRRYGPLVACDDGSCAHGPWQGWASDTPGLLLVQIPEDGGYWQIVHEGSGRIIVGLAKRKHANVAAELLGYACDWTQPYEALRCIDNLGPQIHALLEEAASECQRLDIEAAAGRAARKAEKEAA